MPLNYNHLSVTFSIASRYGKEISVFFLGKEKCKAVESIEFVCSFGGEIHYKECARQEEGWVEAQRQTSLDCVYVCRNKVVKAFGEISRECVNRTRRHFSFNLLCKSAWKIARLFQLAVESSITINLIKTRRRKRT